MYVIHASYLFILIYAPCCHRIAIINQLLTFSIHSYYYCSTAYDLLLLLYIYLLLYTSYVFMFRMYLCFFSFFFDFVGLPVFCSSSTQNKMTQPVRTMMCKYYVCMYQLAAPRKDNKMCPFFVDDNSTGGEVIVSLTGGMNNMLGSRRWTMVLCQSQGNPAGLSGSCNKKRRTWKNKIMCGDCYSDVVVE